MKDLSIYTNDFINYCRLHKGLSAKTLRAYPIFTKATSPAPAAERSPLSRLLCIFCL